MATSARKGAATGTATKAPAKAAAKPAAAKKPAPLSKAKTKALHEEAKSLGIIVRSNMKGEVVAEKIERLKAGEALESINPAPRGSKTGTAKKPAAKATASTAAKPRAKAVKGRTQKTFLVYAADGNELSFVAEAPGATGQIAVANAVKAGVLAPDTPYVFLTPSTVERAVEIEAVEREVQYKVKSTGTPKKKTTPRKPKAEAATPEPAGTSTTPAEADVAPPAETKKRGTSARNAVSVKPPAPGEASTNPFVGK